jgi:hypothetical protein
MINKRSVRWVILFSIVCFYLAGCKSHVKTETRKKKAQQEFSSGESTRQDSVITRTPDKVVQPPYDSVFLKKPLVDCKLIHSPEQKEDDGFLNTFIVFYEVRSLPERRLINEDYCKFILKKTPSQVIEESNFKPGNFEFSHFYTNIDQYGKCYIGKYYFPSAVNSAQRRAIIILQMDLKEVSILNFDDVKFVNGKLFCDFNVRGKHTIRKLKYSRECKRFVSTASVVAGRSKAKLL